MKPMECSDKQLSWDAVVPHHQEHALRSNAASYNFVAPSGDDLARRSRIPHQASLYGRLKVDSG